MGYSVSWLAFRGKDSAAVCAELGLSGSGVHEEIPESPLLGARLPDGWFLIFANRCDFADSAPLARLSHDAEIVTCSVEEHVMASSAACWKDGKRLWSVVHDSQQGGQHLELEGDPPPIFAPIRERLASQQSEHGDVDYIFDIPIELAKALTKFRHDQDAPELPPKPYERLIPCKKWWHFWK